MKKKTLNDVVIKKREKPTVELVELPMPKQPDVDMGLVSYNTFLLFYAYLKAKKYGQNREGGWIAKDIRISQAGDVYTMIYRDLDSEYNYVFDKIQFHDISHIILKHVSF